MIFRNLCAKWEEKVTVKRSINWILNQTKNVLDHQIRDICTLLDFFACVESCSVTKLHVVRHTWTSAVQNIV